MKTPVAACFSSVSLVIVVVYSLVLMRPGLRLVGVSFPRQAWIAENSLLWSLGLWLWLAAFFCWMWVMVSLMWTYLPAHRVASMLQLGLLVISATLATTGVATWMAAPPTILPMRSVNELLPLVDSLALGLFGVSALISGVVMIWVAVDLMRDSPLRRGWLGLLLIAGALLAPSPFLLPYPWHLLAAAGCWLGWALHLAWMRRLPDTPLEFR
jgi:hypothetical protein